VTARNWSVWSLSPDLRNWLEVIESISEVEAKAVAKRRNEYAAAHGMPEAQFIAMGPGQRPGPEHVRITPTAQERIEAQVGPQRLAQDLADAADEDGYDGPIRGAEPAPEMGWLADYRQVVVFAHILDQADEFATVNAVLDYFDGPHKWAPEHAWWVAFGCPHQESGLPWQDFEAKLEAR